MKVNKLAPHSDGAFTKPVPVQNKGLFGAGEVLNHAAPAQTARALKKEKLIAGAHTIFNGIAGAENASLYLSSADIKAVAPAVGKIGGFAHRYFGISFTFAGRMLTTTGSRIAQAALNEPVAKKALQLPVIQSLRTVGLPFVGVYGATMAVGALHGGYKFAYNIYADVKVNKDRKQFQALVKDYDPRNSNKEQAKKLQQLLDKNQHLRTSDAGLVAKSNTQMAYDRIAAGSELYLKSIIASNAFMQLSPLAFISGQVVPGYSLALQVTVGGIYWWRFGTQIAAMNNAQEAVKKTQNPVLVQTTRNVLDERVPLSRAHLGRAVGYTFNSAASIATYAVAATGVGIAAIPALNVAGACAFVTTHAIGVLYEFNHARVTEKLRERSVKSFEADWKNIPKRAPGQSLQEYKAVRREYFAQHVAGREHIGWTEKALIKMLKGANRQERFEAVDYLENLGFSKQTIARVQLSNEPTALRVLASNLYANRLKYNWRANRNLHKSFGETLWISAGIRNIKKLHQRRVEWVAHRKERKLALQNAG